jgi:diphthamide synthase (EF-2-diphthine--ammonia ligase)
MGKALIAWSGGKDSAWALQRLRGAPGIQIAGLFTTVDADDGSIAVHAVRRSLLDAQIKATGLPLYTVYEAAMAGFVEDATRDGVTQLAFGDLFLDDIRRYRERQFAKSGLELLFPLWGEPTRALTEEMIAGGLRARIVCVDLAQAPREWAGKTYDGSSTPLRTPARCSMALSQPA